MTKKEYNALQENLTKLLKKTEYSGNKKEAYMDGVLDAKSVLHAAFKWPEKPAEKTGEENKNGQ